MLGENISFISEGFTFECGLKTKGSERNTVIIRVKTWHLHLIDWVLDQMVDDLLQLRLDALLVAHGPQAADDVRRVRVCVAVDDVQTPPQLLSHKLADGGLPAACGADQQHRLAVA